MNCLGDSGAGANRRATSKSDAKVALFDVVFPVVDAVFASGRGAAQTKGAATTNDNATQKSDKIPLKLFICGCLQVRRTKPKGFRPGG